MIIIYTNSITQRLSYTLDLIFNRLLGSRFCITTDRNEFINSRLPGLNYSDQPFGNKPFIRARDLLFENHITKQNITLTEHEGTKALFPVNPPSSLTFDPLAASFYMVSRYEEYLPFKKDRHLRFEASESLAFKEGFLHIPVVNHWALTLGNMLKKHYPELDFPGTGSEYIPTIDVDNAWAYIHKGAWRQTGAFMKSLITVNFRDITDRLQVLLQRKKDPYDSWEFQRKFHDEAGINPVYFILCGRHGRFDKNISPGNKAFRQLIAGIAQDNEIGIHPSYVSGTIPGLLEKELCKLEDITGRKITKSRQHFLKLTIPGTYRALTRAGITEDYSMGFATSYGFRAGICTPFPFFDLEADAPSGLTVFPIAVMDSAMKYHLGMTPGEALEKIREIAANVLKVNGSFVSLWHNDSLGDSGQWKGWRDVYMEMVRIMQESM